MKEKFLPFLCPVLSVCCTLSSQSGQKCDIILKIGYNCPRGWMRPWGLGLTYVIYSVDSWLLSSVPHHLNLIFGWDIFNRAVEMQRFNCCSCYSSRHFCLTGVNHIWQTTLRINYKTSNNSSSKQLWVDIYYYFILCISLLRTNVPGIALSWLNWYDSGLLGRTVWLGFLFNDYYF